MRALLAGALVCGLLLGCRSNTTTVPHAIQPDRAGWAGRIPGSASVVAYAAHLERLNPDERGAFDVTDGVTVAEAETIALVFNSDLRRARLKARVPLAGARNSGIPDDPRLEFDLLRILQSVANPWIAASALRFTVPLSNRLADERIAAFAAANAAWRAALVAEWDLVTRVRNAWSGWSATHERVRLLEEYLRSVEDVLTIARTQREAEEIGTTELRVLELEQVRREGDLILERARQAQRRLDLKALMGLTPEAEVALVPGFADPSICRADPEGEEALRRSNLELAWAQAKFLAADRAMRLEASRAFPDLEIGPLLESEQGMEQLGAGIGIPLPLWNKNRRAIAEACATRRAARAAYQALYESLVARLARVQAECRATLQRGDWLRERVAPMADKQLAEVRNIVALGDMDVLILKDALSTLVDTKLQLVEARLASSLAANRRRALVAPLRTPSSESGPK